jgi:DHA3 family tetracycline resistance protein-like MFS transporter
VEEASELAPVSAGLLPGVQLDAPTPTDAPAAVKRGRGLRGIIADIREGVGYVTRSPWLWVTIMIASLGNVAFAPLQVAMPRLVRDTYHQGVWLLGAILTAVAVGSIITTLVMGQFKRTRHRGIVAYSALVVSSSALALFGAPLVLQVGPAFALASGALLGAGLGVFELIWTTTMQEIVPADKLGRVSSVDWLGSLSLQPIGLAVMGALTDAIGPAWVFIVGGVFSLLLTLLGLLSRGIRELD